MRCFCLQKEALGQWSVWATSPYTGSKIECLGHGTWSHCRALGRRWNMSGE
jgi:hypothetical protein